MQTILIELKNQKAYRLLKELEDLHLIRLVKTPSKLDETVGSWEDENEIDNVYYNQLSKGHFRKSK